MKKTLLFLLCFCSLSLSTWETQAVNPKNVFVDEYLNDLPTGYDDIVLLGNLMLSVGPNAIEAGYNDNSVYIQFNQNLGYVDVTIYNSNGLMVYNDVVNTAVQQLLVIPITGFVDGVYTIVLENATGYADGEFEKNP